MSGLQLPRRARVRGHARWGPARGVPVDGNVLPTGDVFCKLVLSSSGKDVTSAHLNCPRKNEAGPYRIATGCM